MSHSKVYKGQTPEGRQLYNILLSYATVSARGGGGGGGLPYKGLTGTCEPTGYGFQDFCLERGIYFAPFYLKRGIFTWTNDHKLNFYKFFVSVDFH